MVRPLKAKPELPCQSGKPEFLAKGASNNSRLRGAGTFEWNRPEKGNHNWVEVWDGTAWSFTGPAEWSPKGLNDTWFFPNPAMFQTPGSRQHAIFAASWKPTPDGYFPLSWTPNDTSINGLDVTTYYRLAAAKAETVALSQRLAAAAQAPKQVQIPPV
jgi:hypothetical protein